MSASANLPVVKNTQTVAEALQAMIDSETSAVLIEAAGNYQLLTYDALWEAWKTQEQLAGLTGKPLGVTTEQERDFETKTFTVLKPVFDAASFVVVLAPPGEAAAYNLAPKVKTCRGAQKHTLPPTRPAPNGNCGACGSQVS
jgi:hypothetical protein